MNPSSGEKKVDKSGEDSDPKPPPGSTKDSKEDHSIQTSDKSPTTSTSGILSSELDTSEESEECNHMPESEGEPPADDLNHIEVLEGSPPIYLCKICGKQFKTRAQQKYHLYCKGGQRPFKCDHCSKTFISKGHFEDHIKKHYGELCHTCPSCPQKFVNSSALKRHSRVHVGGPRYSCDLCDKNFSSAQTLKEHRLIHSGERPFACPHCPQTFHRRSIFKKHLRTHTGERPYLCEICGNSFAQLWTYSIHLLTHSNDLPYSCDLCSRKFGSHRNLLRHRTVHKNERNYTCEYCGKRFRRKDNLDRHLKSMHPDGRGTGGDVSSNQMNSDKPKAILSKLGADLNALDGNGNNLLHLAVSDGRSLEELEILVGAGVDWSAKNSSNQSVLHLAALNGDLEAMGYFLALGGNVEERDSDLKTALHWAAFTSKNFIRMTRLLMEKGADLTAMEKEGNGVVHLATYSGRSREELEELVNLGCCWKGVNSKGQSVLHLAAESGNVEAIRYFVSLGADVNGRSLNGEAPLHRAHLVKHNFNETIKILVEYGADLNAVDNLGNSLLHAAVITGKAVQDLQYIVELGCDWKLKSNCGHSVLHSAAQSGHFQAAKYFISLGTEVNGKDMFGVTPIVQLAFAKENFVQTLKVFIENGGNINGAGVDGNSLLLLSAKLGGRTKDDFEAVVTLGGDLEAKNANGQSALHLAAATGNMEGMEYFIFWGAKVNARDSSGRTPLHYVLEGDSEDIRDLVRFLVVESGADINAVNGEGNNAVLIATAAGRSVEELKVLVDLGGKWKEVVNKLGQNVLDLASDGGNLEALNYFGLMWPVALVVNDDLTEGGICG